MNCREFEYLLSDLAAEQVSDIGLRQLALGHSETCGRCAVRLADERSLRAGLEALALSVRSDSSPTDLESRLIRRFRERIDFDRAAPQKSSSDLRVLSDSKAVGTRWRRALVYVGLAASVLILFGILFRRDWPGGTGRQARDLPQPLKEGTFSTKTSTAVAKHEPDLLPEKEPVPLAGNTKTSGLLDHQKVHPRLHKHRQLSQPSGKPAREEPALQALELRTEFLPFLSARQLSPSEPAQMVRVRLPRSALGEFGLPVNMERSREPVQADVLLGEDGTALAVRFVR